MLKLDNEFMEMNKKLVYKIISKYANENNREDLFQVGMIAVIKSSKVYDPSKNVKFSTFAYKNILGEVLKYLRENKNVKPSRDTIRDNARIIRIKEYYYLTEGKEITSIELSKLTGIPEYRINEIQSACLNSQSLTMPIGDDGYALEDTLKCEEEISISDRTELKDALEKLSEKERKFLYQRYFENRTQTEIAKEQSTNQVKIYRYEKSLLNKLRSELI